MSKTYPVNPAPHGTLKSGDVSECDLQGIDDLPKFLRRGIMFTPCRWKKTFILIQLMVQFGLFIPVFGQITGSVTVSTLLAGCLFAGNIPLMLQPDFTSGVFLRLLLRDAKMTKRMSENTSKEFVVGLILFCLITSPLMWYFFIIPFATTSEAFGPYTFEATIFMGGIATIGSIPMNMINSCQALSNQVSLAHISTIKEYIENIRNIILNDNSEDGILLVDKLSDEQTKVESWIEAVNSRMTVFQSSQLCSLVLACALFFIIAAGKYSVGATVVFSIVSLGVCMMIGSMLYSIAKPNMIWERRKVKLLNDAKVVLNLKFPREVPREDFEAWLQMHNINACRIFGTKITFHIMKQAAGVIYSLFGIALYSVFRDDAEGLMVSGASGG